MQEADVKLLFGAAEGSVGQIRSDLVDMLKEFDTNPIKIKIGVIIDQDSINRFRAQISEINKLMGGTGKVSVGTGTTTSVNKEIQERVSLEKQVKEAIASTSSTKTAADSKAISEERAKQAVLKQSYTLLTQMQRAEEKWTASKAGKTAVNYAAIQSEIPELQKLINQFNAGAITIDQFKMRLSGMNARFTQNSSLIKAAGENTQTLSERVGTLTKKFGEWFSITRVVMAVYRTMRQMVKNVVELDTAMTELKKVTDETDTAYAKFLDNATVRARRLGAALTDTVRATSDFARLGYGIADAEKLSDVAIVYKNVGDGIEDINTASESIIATMQAFGIGAEDAMSIVDKFNEVGNNYAISSKGVGDALLRSAAAMHSANNSLDETIALATAANTVVQDPDKVGTTLKTVSMFLRAAKTEAEDAGESTDGMASSISELREEIWRLTDKKVDIQIDDDTFKSTYQILKELSEVWDELSDVTQANILELAGGKRNSNVVSALLENFSVAEKALQTSLGSSGSALAENEKVLESIQGRLNIFKAAFEEFSNNVIGSDLVKAIVSAGTALMNFLNLWDGLIAKITLATTALMVLPGVFKTIAGVKLFSNIGSSITNSISALNAFGLALSSTGSNLSSVIGKLSMSQAAMVLSSKNLNVAQASQLLISAGLNREERIAILQKAGLITATGVQTGANGKLALSIGAITKGLIAQAAAWLATPMGMATAVIGSIYAIAKAVGYFNKKIEENRQELIAEGKESADTARELDALVEKYRQLGADGKFDNSEKQQAYEIQKQINELLGEEVGYINLANGSYEQQLILLQKLQYEKAKESNYEQKSAKDAASDALYDAADAGINGGFTVGVGVVGLPSEYSAVDNFLKDNGYDEYIKYLDKYDKEAVFEIKHNSEEEVIQSYEDMIDILEILEDKYADQITAGGKLEDFYNTMKDRVGEMSDAVRVYKEALASYNINEAIVQFNETDFGGVRGALIQTEEEFNNWINAMIASTEISDGVKEQLIGLARTQYPQYTDAIKKATEEHLKAKAAALDSEAILNGEAKAIFNLGSQCGYTSKEMLELISNQIIFNSTSLDVSGKVEALADLAGQFGITTSAAMMCSAALAGINDPTGRRQIHIIAQQYGVKLGGVNGPEYNGVAYNSIAEAIQAAMVADVSSWTIQSSYNSYSPKTETDRSSSKNDPDQEDPTEAVIRGINKDSDAKRKALESSEQVLGAIDAEEDYAVALEQTNKVIEDRTGYIDSLSGANGKLQNEIDYIMAINSQYDNIELPDGTTMTIESWFDDNNEATKTYIDFYNSLDAESQKSVKTVFESLQKYRKAIAENNDEIRAQNEKLAEDTLSLVDLTIAKVNAKSETAEKKLSDSQDKLDLLDPEEDYAAAIAQNDEVIDNRISVIDARKTANGAIHDAAEDLRKNTTYDTESWFDSEGNATQEYIDFFETLTDAEKASVQSLFDAIQKYKKGYLENLDVIAEEEKNLAEDRKKSIEWEEARVNKIVDEIGRHIERQIEAKEKEIELLEGQIALEQALVDGQQAYYDAQERVLEARKEINTELAASKQLSGWADEHTRQLLFNENDYKELSETLDGIDSGIQADWIWYQSAINQLGEDESEKAELITKEYERRLAMREREYEIARAELNLAKREQELDNILRNKNVKMVIGGQIQNVADFTAAKEAAEAVEEARYDLESANRKSRQSDAINKKQAGVDSLEATKINLELDIKNLQENFEELELAVEDMINPLQDLNSLFKWLVEKGNTLVRQSSGEVMNSELGGEKVIKTISGVELPTDLKINAIYDNVPYSTTFDYAAEMDKHPVGSPTWNELNRQRNAKIKALGLDVPKYATGTERARSGVAIVDEEGIGSELYIPLEGGTFHNFQGGERVFNAEQSRNLFKLSKANFASILPSMTASIKQLFATRFASPDPVMVEKTSIGQIVVNNPRDYNDFVWQLSRKMGNRP